MLAASADKGIPVNDASNPRVFESTLVLREADCASASMRVEGLPNPVLVQLVGTPLGGERCFSLYCVYREGTVTFDAIYRFAMQTVENDDAPLPRLDETLQQYLLTAPVEAQLLDPLIREVGLHFGR
jgi:hypothetical protein